MFEPVGAAGEPTVQGCEEPAVQALRRSPEQPSAKGYSTNLFVERSSVLR